MTMLREARTVVGGKRVALGAIVISRPYQRLLCNSIFVRTKAELWLVRDLVINEKVSALGQRPIGWCTRTPWNEKISECFVFFFSSQAQTILVELRVHVTHCTSYLCLCWADPTSSPHRSPYHLKSLTPRKVPVTCLHLAPSVPLRSVTQSMNHPPEPKKTQLTATPFRFSAAPRNAEYKL